VAWDVHKHGVAPRRARENRVTFSLKLPRDQRALAILVGAYCAAGLTGLQLAFLNKGVSPVAPQAGIALAAFVMLGYRVWPAVLLGAFLAYVIALGSLPVALAIAVGNTAEGLLAAYLVNRFAGGRSSLQNPQNTLRFAAVAALASTSVSATCGAATLAVGGFATWADYGGVWTTWCLGNLAGSILVAPCVMLWGPGSWTIWRPRKAVEAGALLVAVILVGLLVFCGIPADAKDFPVEFLCVPVLVWAAFRLGRREAATAILVLTAIAIAGTLAGHGPFFRKTGANDSLLWLLTFMSIFSVMTMALAALASEYAVAETQLRALVVTDPLTGLPNYRRLVEVLQAEILRADRIERPFSVVFFDMDGLKLINDEFGHLAGSRAVCRLADTLRECCRATDTPARFGGDEFVVVLPDTDDTGARHVVRRVSERLAKDNDKPILSVSAGIATYPRDGSTPATLLSSADRVLYKVKGEKTDERKKGVVAIREWSGTAVR
jgi:diguanylate cyclase (GGDEF)-like protein